MVMNIVSTLIRNENFGGGGSGGNNGNNGNESESHPPFHQNQNSGPQGQAFVSTFECLYLCSWKGMKMLI